MLLYRILCPPAYPVQYFVHFLRCSINCGWCSIICTYPSVIIFFLNKSTFYLLSFAPAFGHNQYISTVFTAQRGLCTPLWLATIILQSRVPESTASRNQRAFRTYMMKWTLYRPRHSNFSITSYTWGSPSAATAGTLQNIVKPLCAPGPVQLEEFSGW